MKLVKEYPYTDENGNLLYKMARYHNGENKTFRSYRYCNGEWIMNLNDVRHVLYNLPAVIKSDEIYFVEGEKDADNLNTIGLTASTSASGANGFKKYAHEYMESLRDKTIYIIPDNDEAGRKYANDVYCAVCKVAKKVQILDLLNEIPELKEKGDISDVLEEYGKEKTLEIIEKLKENNYESISINIRNTYDLNKESLEVIKLDIENLSKEEIIDKSTFKQIFAREDEIEREEMIIKIEERAEELGCLSNFKRLLKIYTKNNKVKKEEKLKHNEVADILLEENSIAIYNNNLYIYIDGVYRDDRKYIERKIIEINPEADSRFRDEVYKYLFLKKDIHVTLDKESGIVNFKNGLFNIKEKKLYKHTHEFFSINQININYNENAKKIQAVEDFFDKISTNKKERKQTILEMIGYSMTTSVKLQKAFILYGETARNGKSTLSNIVTALLGQTNVANVSFKDMNKHRFATSGIKGKLLNIGSEMTEDYLEDVSIIKMFITGDYLEVEEKHKAKESISPYAKFIFNANTLPRVADKTNGFYRRLQIIPLETSFSDEDARKFNINDILTEEALEYLAKISLEAYSLINGQFSNHEESDKEVDKYRIASNSVLAFINDKEYTSALKNDVNGPPLAKKVYEKYEEYCAENKWRPIGRNNFYKEIEKSDAIQVKEWNHQKIYIFKDI